MIPYTIRGTLCNCVFSFYSNLTWAPFTVLACGRVKLALVSSLCKIIFCAFSHDIIKVMFTSREKYSLTCWFMKRPTKAIPKKSNFGLHCLFGHAMAKSVLVKMCTRKIVCQEQFYWMLSRIDYALRPVYMVRRRLQLR